MCCAMEYDRILAASDETMGKRRMKGGDSNLGCYFSAIS